MAVVGLEVVATASEPNLEAMAEALTEAGYQVVPPESVPPESVPPELAQVEA